MDFLRAGPLSLVFIMYFYFLLRAYRTKKLRYFIFAGFFASLLVLGRENFIPVVCIPLIFILSHDVKRRIDANKIFILLLFALMPVLAVCLINQVRFGRFGILPGNAVNVISFYYPGYKITFLNFALWSELFSRVITNLFKYISSYEIPNSLSVYAHSDFSPMLDILLIPFNAIIIPVLFLPFFERRRDVLLLFFLIVGYFCSMIIFEPFYRFRIPAVPLLCSGMGFFLFKISKQNKITIFVTCAIIMILVFFTYENPNFKRTVAERKATIRILINQGLFSKAERRIRELASEGYDVSSFSNFQKETTVETSSSVLNEKQ